MFSDCFEHHRQKIGVKYHILATERNWQKRRVKLCDFGSTYTAHSEKTRNYAFEMFSQKTQNITVGFPRQRSVFVQI